MKSLILIALLLGGLTMPIMAQEITAPQAPDQVQDLMPEETESFGQGVLYILKNAMQDLRPEIANASNICMAILAVMVLMSVLSHFPGATKEIIEFAGTIAVSCLLLSNANTLITNGRETVSRLSEYGKLLLGVMATALASQGGVTSSAALYTGTAVFDAVLCGLISKALVPLIYVFLALAIVAAAMEEDLLKRLRDFIKWLLSWCLKTVLYIFTGYITITGVVSGTTDQAALKAAKLTISGAVPVVGGILSDASEAVLVSAGVVKNAVGIYGLLAVTAIVVGPFLQIGIQYLLLKLTAGICGVIAGKKNVQLVEDFSFAMGVLLAMTGAMSLMLLISMVCFMKGMGV